MFSANSTFHLRGDIRFHESWPLDNVSESSPHAQPEFDALENLITSYVLRVNFELRDKLFERLHTFRPDVWPDVSEMIHSDAIAAKKILERTAMCSEEHLVPDPMTCFSLELDFFLEYYRCCRYLPGDEPSFDTVSSTIDSMYNRLVRRMCQIEIVKSSLVEAGAKLETILEKISESGSHKPFEGLSVFSKLVFIRLLQNDFLHGGGENETYKDEPGEVKLVIDHSHQYRVERPDDIVQNIVTKVRRLLMRVLVLDDSHIERFLPYLPNRNDPKSLDYQLPDPEFETLNPKREGNELGRELPPVLVSESVQVQKREPEPEPESEPEPRPEPEPEPEPETEPEPERVSVSEPERVTDLVRETESEPVTELVQDPVQEPPKAETSKPRHSDLSNAFMKELNRLDRVKKHKNYKKWDDTRPGKPPKLGGAAEPSDRSDGLSAFLGIAVSLAVVVASAIAGAAKGGG